MTDLPISSGNLPAKVTAAKPSHSDEAVQPDAQPFGNVLARQLADPGKPAPLKPESSADGTRRSDQQVSADPAPLTDSSAIPPGDMLAALLAQQNPTHTPQPGVNIQPDANIPTFQNPQIAGNTTLLSDKKKSAPLTLVGSDVKLANTSRPSIDTALPQAEVADKSSNKFSSAFKALVMKEPIAPADPPSLHGSVISELANSAQQPIVPAPVPAVTIPASPTLISADVAQPAWGDEFSQKITWMATQHNQSAELHLNPPQLGPLDVVLKMSGDQATATFTSPHAAVRDAIEQALPKLREMMADNGIMLGNAMVSDQSAKNHQDNSSHTTEGRSPISATGASAEAVNLHDARVPARKSHNGLVDTFA